MTTQAKSRPAPTFPDLDRLTDLLRTPPLTTADHLRHIRGLGQRIAGYIRFMGAVDRLSGTSTEAKQYAVAAFYERLASMERQLGRIQEDLRPG